MGISDYRKIADFFKALSHPTRIVIVLRLLEGKKCVGNLKELVKAPQPNISQHLSIMKANDIVDWIQQGKMKCYFLKEPKLLKDLFSSGEEFLKRNK